MWPWVGLGEASGGDLGAAHKLPPIMVRVRMTLAWTLGCTQTHAETQAQANPNPNPNPNPTPTRNRSHSDSRQADSNPNPNLNPNPNPNPNPTLHGTIHKVCQTSSCQWETRLYTHFQWQLWLVRVRDENHFSLN